jgi:hypothetical protein
VNELNRYNIACIQAQQTLGGNALIVDPNGHLVMYSDYKLLEDKVAELEAQAQRDSFCYTEVTKYFMAERLAHETLKDKLKNDTRI